MKNQRKALFVILTFISLLVTSCAAGTPGAVDFASLQVDSASLPQLRDYGPAPELTNSVWINTDHPLRLADLRGKVVLLDMWTFDCINCRNTLPALKDWQQRYANKGLVIIGNHFPEFGNERDLGNLQEAVKELGILYPVAQDNDGKTWEAYHNRYWPTMYLIDKHGRLRYMHIGEGEYAATEKVIQALLVEGTAKE